MRRLIVLAAAVAADGVGVALLSLGGSPTFPNRPSDLAYADLTVVAPPHP